MEKRSLEDRKAVRDTMNNAFEIVEADGPIISEVKIKNQDAVSEIISIFQGTHEIGIEGFEGDKTAEFALNENIKDE